MVGASDVDSSSAYSTSSSSSSEDEGDRRKGRKSYKNLSGLSCFARDGFYTMALSSGNKKSTQSDSDSDSDDEVGDLKNIWLIDSGCSRHMTGDKGWFSSLILVVTKRCITFGDNGRPQKITLRHVALVQSLGTICFLCPSYWMRVLRCCFGLVVLGFWTLEGTLSVWSFLSFLAGSSS
jgi:hypothetical protein